MSEKNLVGFMANENSLTRRDLVLLREYVDLLNRRKDLSLLLQRERHIASKNQKGDGSKDNKSHVEFANNLLMQDSDIALQEQGLIDQMSDEAKKEAYTIKASVSDYLEKPANGELM